MGLKNHDTKRNKLEEKCQEPYYFTHRWDIKVKATNKTNKQKLIDTHNTMVVTSGNRYWGHS